VPAARGCPFHLARRRPRLPAGVLGHRRLRDHRHRRRPARLASSPVRGDDGRPARTPCPRAGPGERGSAPLCLVGIRLPEPAAAALYDAPHGCLRQTAPRAWRRGFASGAAWMRLALETVRGIPCPPPRAGHGRLGFTKYGLAAAAALVWAGAAWALRLPLLAP